MKSMERLSFVLPALLCLALTGCTTSRPARQVGGGYQEVTHRARSGDPDDTRISLEYRAADGKINLIWPSLSGVPEIIHGDVALFVGDKTYASPDPDEPQAAKPRLFAVQEPGLPVDITDEILWSWSALPGKDIAKAERLLEMVTPVETDGKLEVKLDFWEDGYGWPDSTRVDFMWNQVLDIMRTVKEKGAKHRDLRWHTPYIEN